MPFVIIKVILTVLPLQKISKDLVKKDFVNEEDFPDRKYQTDCNTVIL